MESFYNLLQNGVYSFYEGSTSQFLAYAVLTAFLILCFVVPYLIGSLNSAIVISKLYYHDDIRKHGSGNAGATNMLRTFGWGAAIATLACDALKTALAVFFGWIIMGAQWVGLAFSFSPGGYFAMIFCVLGHIYPLYFGMKGGKGVLCTAVGVAILSPWVALILIIIFIGTVAMTKYVSLGSLICAATYPVFLSLLVRALFRGLPLPFELLIISFATTALLIFAHRDNIQRLRNHEENRLSFHNLSRKKKHDDSSQGGEE